MKTMIWERVVSWTSHPQSARWIVFGLTVMGLIVSLVAPESAAACPASSGGSPGT
jgi:hypothetical protein